MTGPEPARGVWRHHKGHLYQLLHPCALSHAHWDGAFLYPALWSSNGPCEGAAISVEAVPWKGAEGGVRILAHPTTEDVEWGDGNRGVVYIGLTLDGEPKPGHRVRVCDLPHWDATVAAPGGHAAPRFRYLGSEWHPKMGRA